MAPLHKVAIAGATGALGKNILDGFVKAGVFSITVLTRDASKASVPEGVTAKTVDYYNPESLAAAFAGQDAVVNATSQFDTSLSIKMVEAAAAAGVRRYVPPDFGGDPDNQFVAALPPYHSKHVVYEQLKELAAAGKMEYTIVSNGSFLEWNLETGFYGIDLKNKKISLFGGPETSSNPHPLTSMPSIGAATAQALVKADETRNRVVYISSCDKSQRGLADLAKKTLGGDWQEETLDMKAKYEASMEQVKKGVYSWEVLGPLIQYAAVLPEASHPYAKSDNELLGVKQMTDDDIAAVIKKLAA